MRPKSSSSGGVEDARNALGQASKVSKIENGKQTPADDDIEDWTRATHSEQEAESLLVSLHTLEVQHAEWKRVLKAGMLPHQMELSETDQQTRLYRSFEPAVVPGPAPDTRVRAGQVLPGCRVETYTAELNLRQPHEIESYVATFQKLAAVAAYGASARAIINRAIADLAASLPDTSP